MVIDSLFEIICSSSPVVVTSFDIPSKISQHIYEEGIFQFLLSFQFLNCWWVSTNKSAWSSKEVFISIGGLSLYGVIQEESKQ
jgi:hypothetical protein